MKYSASSTTKPVAAAILAVGFWFNASGTAAADAAGDLEAVRNTGVPSARELLSLCSPLSGGVLYSSTLGAPIWSADGSQIAFLGNFAGGSFGLWSTKRRSYDALRAEALGVVGDRRLRACATLRTVGPVTQLDPRARPIVTGDATPPLAGASISTGSELDGAWYHFLLPILAASGAA